MGTLPNFYRPSKRFRPYIVDDLGKRCRALFESGWVPKFSMICGCQWECLLDCGVDKLPSNIPRPSCIAATYREALYGAMEARNRLLTKKQVPSG